MVPRTALTSSWPARTLPEIDRAGRFSHRDQTFDVVYRMHRTSALHQYEYACTMRIAGRDMKIEPGDFTVSPQGEETSYHVPRAGHHLCVHFRRGDMSARGGKVAIPLHVRPGPMQHTLNAQFLSVIRWHRLGREHPAARAAASAAVQELMMALTMVNREAAVTRDRRESAADEAAEFLERRLDQTVSVPELANVVGLSQNYLARSFRNRFGMTIPHYLLTRRIELAGELLLSTELPVKQIADRVGLSDPHHFNKQFRRMTGMSPTRYRDRGQAGQMTVSQRGQQK